MFSSTIINELTSNDVEMRMHAVKKFTIFWKLTAKDEFYKPFLTTKERVEEKKKAAENLGTKTEEDLD